MSAIEFTKMHGAGNDYVYIDCRHRALEGVASLARRMSDRHTGIGGDGIILIESSTEADCRMRIINADGSEAQMCGNGIRCVAKYVYDRGIVTNNPMRVETLGGVKVITVRTGEDGLVTDATVDMGVPVSEPKRIPVRWEGEQMMNGRVTLDDGNEVEITAVSMGNPHGVVFVPSLDEVDVHGLGRQLENHPIWPERANIEFVEVVEDGSLRMRVWERGSGETMACGTGACATAVAAMITGRIESNRVTVRLLGGDLEIERREDGHIMMTGPAVEVFIGTYETKE